MATTNNNNNLFGEDSDSSDESVGGGAAAAAAAKSTSPTRTKIDDIGGDDESSSDDNDEPKKTVTTDKVEKDDTTNKSDDNSGGDTKDETKEAPEKEKVATTNNTNNSALFGDDDDDTEDDEFDGEDDGIVGKSGGVNKVIKKAENVGQTMNQRMGLDSDGDEEMEGTKSSKDENKEGDSDKKPAYVPPRKMQLLDLAEAGIKTSYDESVPPDQRPVFHLVKLPNLVGIQPKPYDRETHDLEKEEEEYRGYVHNMIRWRYKTNEDGEYIRDEHGQPIRESNTRLVKWSDGSYTLHVGTEVLEMDNLDSSIPMNHPDPSMAGFAGNNGYLYVSQKAKIIPPTKKEMEGPPKSDEDEENDDTEEQEEEQPEAKNAGTVLECIASIASRLAPRPLSLASDAHRNLTLAVRQRAVKRARIAEIVTEVDPEKEKMARIKGKDDLAKSRARSSGRRSTPGSSGRKHGMNKQYMEEDDDEYDGVNLGRMKKETMRRGDSSEEEEMDYGDSDESEDEWQKNKVQKRGAAVAASKQQESDSDGEIVFGEDDSDEEALGKKRAAGSSGAKKTGVFGDSDDE